MFKKAFDFFVFSSLFIAVGAVLTTYQTAWLFQLAFPWTLAAFIFSGTVCSYNLHWYLTPPILPKGSKKLIWNITYKRVHLILFVLGLCGSALTAFLLIDQWLWLGITAFVTFLYTAPKITHPVAFFLRKIAVGKTIFLALAWAHITSLLPIVVTVHRVRADHIWFVLNRFFFIYALCIVFDFRDVEEDRKAGIRSLITYLDERGIDMLFWITIACFGATLWVLRIYFAPLKLAAFGIPCLLLCFLYYPSKKSTSDYLYYFVLDGLMMLSAPLLLLTKFAG